MAVRVVAVALVAVLLFLGVTFVQVWQASRRDGAREADAIVVFGAAQYNGRPSAVLRARLDHAVDLYERKLARVVVVTGGRQAGDSQTEAGASAAYLQEKGVPGSAILWEPYGRNSWQQLASVAGILRQRNLPRVVLVTDPFHAERVHEMAGELGLDATVSPTRTSPISGATELRHLVKETAAVAVGRVVGFRRAVGLRDTVAERRT
ncbi:MAG TPA: YdcF family protein [Acidimicrobiales bacterium]|nr:YdcF family protein [Acidimicrobiales bacterium]